ncbi:hypothetical protein MCUN1_000842 [Malassezia cuniculi]|uniref:Uncharacterized protein n=1 Tax=Malassezia cuniculi TaxID=948313 RepID=A0AAF0ES32_9BASI|nr:hypothetical protein MCUN1_000842 [Malassezia cuniculi]
MRELARRAVPEPGVVNRIGRVRHRYWVPFVQPPALGNQSGHQSGHQSLSLALYRADVETCSALLESLPPSSIATLPYSLWESLWALAAQGPSSEPIESLDARLELCITRLSQLRTIHAAAYPGRPFPRMATHRFVYLLIKQLERAQKVGTKIDPERVTALVSAIGDPMALDCELLGRLVFRLAKLGRFAELAPLLDTYASRSDRVPDTTAAAQPFAAVAEEGARQKETLLFALDALQKASELHLSLRGSIVQHVVSALDTPLLYSLATGTQDTPGPVAKSAHHLRDAYKLEYRAAVILCRRGDPFPAMELATHGAEHVPFDVFAAAISALTWMARDAVADGNAGLAHGALAAALQVFDSMHGQPGSRGFDGDEQVYGELIRAFEAVLALGRGKRPVSRPPQKLAQSVAGRLNASMQDWRPRLKTFTMQIVTMLETDHVLRPAHFAALLRENARAGHFDTCRALYEAMQAHTDALPLPCTHAVLSWLIREACRRHQASFAVMLYDDWRAGGRMPALPDALQLVELLLRRGGYAAAHRIVEDMNTWPELNRDMFARGMVRMFLALGHHEQAFDVAVQIYRDEADDDSQAPPPLAAYAALLREAADMPRSPVLRGISERIFDEFQLACAHTLALSIAVDDEAIRSAYKSMVAMCGDRSRAQHLLTELSSLVTNSRCDEKADTTDVKNWMKSYPSAYYHQLLD